MNQTHDHQSAGSESAAPAMPLNRAERRAKGKAKGKATAGQGSGPQKNDQLRHSQVLAQPKLKGKRGNR
jgi:hypothetical protein